MAMNRREFAKSCFLAGGLKLFSPTLLHAQQGSQLSRWVLRAQPMMGSVVEIGVFGHDIDKINSIIGECFDLARQVIAKVSSWIPGSQTSQLRIDREIELDESSHHLLYLISRSQLIKSLSQDKFNPLVFDLMQEWRLAKVANRIPKANIMKALCRDIAGTSIEVKKDRIKLHGPASLDFGGIGKGYIADVAIEFLRSRGVEIARVACSGDLRFLGNLNWKVVVQNPRGESSIGALDFKGDLAVSTSGDYRNFIDSNSGVQWSHIIDLSENLPARECQQVTVVSSKGISADSLSTAAFLLGAERSLGLFNVSTKNKFLFVSASGEIIERGFAKSIVYNQGL